jgi:ubiquinone/menaquinone biosynthesis C-methylase UbiE
MAAPATAEAIRDVNTRYHDDAAASYDAKWGIDFGPIGFQQVWTKMRKAMGTEPPVFADALEIGAGTGYFSLNLALAGKVRRATCTDISPGMLDVLCANAERLGLDVRTEACDAAVLPFEDGAFDLVLGHAVLHHLPDLGAAFAEFHRVLRPGGWVVFAGEPSRTGDRIATWPKRLAFQASPAWRRALGAREAEHHGQHGDADPQLETMVDVHAFVPDDLVREAGSPGSTACACAARSCWPTGSAGPTARSSRPPIPRPSRGRGSSTPTAAISPCRPSTARCWRVACRRRSSTT